MIDLKHASEQEMHTLHFWKSEKIYEKAVQKNSKGKAFYLMDGPPYATGNIHIGTALNKILKDIALRVKRLQGYAVFDRPGYDTHGIPIEFQVEKEIGSKNKQDIERYGVEKFIQRCKKFATHYIGTMNAQFMNLGVWMDWNTPYLTLDNAYIEAIWSAFKEAEKKGLLYLGKYPVHVCTRCETAVAYNEIEYGKQKDLSIFVKFPVKKKKNTFLIIWTTTPWTLPGNTGVMVHPEVDYQEIETKEGEHWIIAKELVPSFMAKLEREFTVKNEYKGKKLEGLAYEHPLAHYLHLKIKNGYKVVLSARYVTTQEGTGLVHCAPGHGKEDFEVGRDYGLDMPSPVTISGVLTEEAGKYAGKKAREVDKEIIADLKKDGSLIDERMYEHEYPLCWRDKSPLLMISQPQWFLKISKIQKKILKENEKVNWVPDWMKLRMKAWLEGIGDWPVSRQRYWGSPLPIWCNEETGERIVVGSIDELKKLSGAKKIEMHKPGIDALTITSPSGTLLKRVPEVLDVWFDSGVSSWAALGYPREKEKFKKFWPANINIEGRDQIRGWWNSQLILSEIAFGKKPFDTVMVHGMVLDVGKKKMSKSLGNIIDPEHIISTYGRDYLRYYLAKFSKGEDFSFNEEEMVEIRKVLSILLNTHAFVDQLQEKKQVKEKEDDWILSRYNTLVKEVSEAYEAYTFTTVVQKIEDFIVNDLSRTYIQMIRERSDETYSVLHPIRIGLLKLLAPLIPFLSEALWQELRKKGTVQEESVHLSSFPKVDEKKITPSLEKEFALALHIVELGLAERDKAKLGLRWPLAQALVTSKNKLSKDMREIIARQLQVKKVEVTQGERLEVALDTILTPDLEAEGYSRELARKIQATRKEAGLERSDRIALEIYADNSLLAYFKKHIAFLKERVNASKVVFSDDKLPSGAIVSTIRERRIGIKFRNSRIVQAEKI